MTAQTRFAIDRSRVRISNCGKKFKPSLGPKPLLLSIRGQRQRRLRTASLQALAAVRWSLSLSLSLSPRWRRRRRGPSSQASRRKGPRERPPPRERQRRRRERRRPLRRHRHSCCRRSEEEEASSRRPWLQVAPKATRTSLRWSGRARAFEVFFAARAVEPRGFGFLADPVGHKATADTKKATALQWL